MVSVFVVVSHEKMTMLKERNKCEVFRSRICDLIVEHTNKSNVIYGFKFSTSHQLQAN